MTNSSGIDQIDGSGPASWRVPVLSQVWIFLWTFFVCLGTVSGLQLPGNFVFPPIGSRSPVRSFACEPLCSASTFSVHGHTCSRTEQCVPFSQWTDVGCVSVSIQEPQCRLSCFTFIPWGEALTA